jgi:hypothetical protein
MIVAGLELTSTTSIAFLPQRLARLRAGIIEFAGLADDDGAGADDQNGGKVSSFWHSSNQRSEKAGIKTRSSKSSPRISGKRQRANSGSVCAKQYHYTQRKSQLGRLKKIFSCIVLGLPLLL